MMIFLCQRAQAVSNTRSTIAAGLPNHLDVQLKRRAEINHNAYTALSQLFQDEGHRLRMAELVDRATVPMSYVTRVSGADDQRSQAGGVRCP
ncbi:hypothetical protein EAH68_03900 [Corynebacterium hylobatis]|uniref:Uncharacterized protein n=1 Tax=Corynebacterium hylobatis TaxID=1859290 RepID=A0A3S0B5K5_9CORY|nr:hypothetical protein [Corynebacterium hylobatis]RSZ64751.1 hypothetical protein EAH68_03900 [Corynebacterium hylobatis]